MQVKSLTIANEMVIAFTCFSHFAVFSCVNLILRRRHLDIICRRHFVCTVVKAPSNVIRLLSHIPKYPIK